MILGATPESVAPPPGDARPRTGVPPRSAGSAYRRIFRPREPGCRRSSWERRHPRSLQYLFGVKIITPFRVVWSLAALVGATLKLGFVWLLADTLNALMAIPNLIALALLSPIVFKITKEFFDTRGQSEDNPF